MTNARDIGNIGNIEKRILIENGTMKIKIEAYQEVLKDLIDCYHEKYGYRDLIEADIKEAEFLRAMMEGLNKKAKERFELKEGK